MMTKLGRNTALGVAVAACLAFAACAYHKAPSERVSHFLEGGGGGGGDRDRVREGRASAGLMITNGAPGFADGSTQKSEPAIADRKIIRNGSLDLLVNDVPSTVDKIRSV